ncbi:MAG: histidinol dehydrogenase [Thermoguttaceae bacterium]|nr:histidinol dehydrogenase [Thermoguttaceae bacterium]MBR5758646.1 histidinol dehydrogenase [Thermoguttaceae bacterium]
MSENALKLAWIDARKDDVGSKIDALRQKLSLKGNVVSEAGKKRTIEIFGAPLTPAEVVAKICGDVAEKGLPALLEYSERVDRAQLTAEELRVPDSDLEAALQAVEPEYLASVDRIRDNIMRFQRSILHKSSRIDVEGGWLGQRYQPLRRVGVCVPGGAAAYPSSVLMTVVPAQVAGVKEIAVMAPPTPNGSYNKYLLATCARLGVSEVYRMGGAQGVAAFAYGVEGIERVDKIVGPGNMFVALAKKSVYGIVDIDSIAGPSEVVVIVDESTRADFTAYDILAQAEHAPGSSILVGWNEQTLRDAVKEIDATLSRVERGDLARQALESFGAVILTENADDACYWTNLIAPEHLHIATQNAEELAAKIPCAGAIFMGNYTPVALGDYAAGPSHVLPTSGSARFSSGLSCNDFLRGNSLLCFSQEGLDRLADDVYRIATVEGLTAHRGSVDVRRSK